MSESLISQIERLKARRRAVIVAHNYQPAPVQDIADFTGDSLALSRQAAETDAEVIVFCGVMFMAETAAILSPQKTVLLPEKKAGCPMADMITAPDLEELKAKHPDAVVVCYVNSPAEVKALSDYCCTSSNAVEVVKSVPSDREIIFVPDRYLGQHVMDSAGRDMLLWPGYCPTHVKITVEDIEKCKALYPDAVVMAHPECTEQVRMASDAILSTGQMLTFVKKSPTERFIVATETGIIHTLKKQNPQKIFLPVSDGAICPNMKLISLEKILWSLQDLQCRIVVEEDIRVKAKTALDRMLEVMPQQR